MSRNDRDRRRQKRKAKKHRPRTPRVAGLKGEVFRSPDGRVAGIIPPQGIEGAIKFSVLMEYAATKNTPSWADMLIEAEGKAIKCRINPDICQPPFFRLFDCVSIVAQAHSQLPFLESGEMACLDLPPKPHPASQPFVFARTFDGQLVMVDTLVRAKRFQRR